MKERYIKLQAKYMGEKKKLRKKSLFLGISKFVLLLCVIAIGWQLISADFSTGKLAGLISCVVLSLPLWIYHVHVTDQIKKLQSLSELAGQYILRIDGGWETIAESGEEFVDRDHQYSFDLDLYGPKSLYQFLGTAKTDFGRERLKSDLDSLPYNSEEILERQKAVHELAGEDEFVLEAQFYAGRVRDNKRMPELLSRLSESERFMGKGLRLVRLLPVPVLTVIIAAFILNSYTLNIAAVSLAILQAAIWLLGAFKSFAYLRDVGDARHAIEEYAELFKLLSRQQHKSPYLKQAAERFGGDSKSAVAAIGRLDSIVQMIGLRDNILLYMLLNALLLWDFQCICKLDSWKDEFGSHVHSWFETLGDIEALISLAVIESCVTGSCYPSPVDEKSRIRMRDIGHPLIPNDSRVTNSYDIDGNITVISGSNMSGKTTFLRTVGINFVLAKCGGPVCAGSMEFSDMMLMSSMRILDNLQEGVSTFYAELEKISRIIKMAEQHDNILFLIDEIFRGTNSKDRLEGARAVMLALYRHKAAGMLTTHDLKLCESVEDFQAENVNFSETYVNGELNFDYKMKKGIAKTTNGRYLMKMLGLIKEE